MADGATGGRKEKQRWTEVSHAWLTAQQVREKRNKDGQKAAIMADGTTGGRKEKQRWTKVSHAWLTAQQAGEKRKKKEIKGRKGNKMDKCGILKKKNLHISIFFCNFACPKNAKSHKTDKKA